MARLRGSVNTSLARLISYDKIGKEKENEKEREGERRREKEREERKEEKERKGEKERKREREEKKKKNLKTFTCMGYIFLCSSTCHFI